MALNILETNVVLDLYDHDGKRPQIKSIALDDNTRYVFARLTYKGANYDIGSDATVKLIIIRPDKVGAQIVGQAKSIDIYNDDETITTIYGPYAELDQPAIAVAGTLLGQFVITSGDQILRSQIFSDNNGQALDADEWAGQYDGYNLDELVEKVDNAVEKVDGMEADVTELKSALNGSIQPISAISTSVVDGYIASDDGELKAPTSDAEKTTDFIPVTYGAHIDVLATLSSAKYRAGFIYTYDINKRYINRLASVEGGSFSSYTLSADVTDEKVRFVRITVKTFNAFSSIAVNTLSSVGEALKYVYSTYNDLINKVDGEHGKNLFDKTGGHTIISKGCFYAYYSGAYIENAEYEAVMYDVTGGEQYAVNTNNTHICFFGAGKVYISGFLANPSNGYVFTTPNNALSMSVSFVISAEDSFQIEKGTATTTYEEFKWGVSNKDIIGSPTIYNVGADKLYKTIQSAVNVAKNYDIIMIDAGTYNESVDMVGKELHLIGSGRDSTIVKCAGDDYYYPPLEASRGLIENMSFITTATQKAEDAIDTAYCVHIDYDNEAGRFLQFKNCYFQSPIRPTVGIGLRENFTLNFTNCKFKSSVYPIYCHEQQANNKTGQRIEIIDCSIQSTGATSAIHLQESRAYSGNEVTILMQRCVAKANGVSGNNIISAVTYPNNQQPTGSNYLNLNSFYLDTMSALNNEAILNA